MTSRTHDLAAFVALNIIILSRPLPGFSLATAIAALIACFIGGLIPDLDKPTSEVWHKIPAGSILGRLLQPFLGAHRHLSHSILGFGLINLLIKYLFNLAGLTILVNMEVVWLSFAIGYISHILMDTLTVEGVPLFFPIPFHVGFPPIKALRIKTGGKIEKYVVFPGLFLILFYLFINFYPDYLRIAKAVINSKN